MSKFYYEYDEISKTWDVMKIEWALDPGFVVFSCATEQDAINAVELLIKMYEEET